MIAKLIVQGSDRETAIRKLNASLNEYEIAGPITNVEFLKRVCQIPAFVAGQVETGFIKKWQADLFHNPKIPPEAFAQAALGAFFVEAQHNFESNMVSLGAKTGFLSTSQRRAFHLAPIKGDGSRNISETTVEIEQTGYGVFTISVDGSTYQSVAGQFDKGTRRVISYFPHTRLETRFIEDDGTITLFQQGQQYRLRYATPRWVEKAWESKIPRTAFSHPCHVRYCAWGSKKVSRFERSRSWW